MDEDHPFLDPVAAELKNGDFSHDYKVFESSSCKPRWKLCIIIAVVAVLLGAVFSAGLLVGHFAIPKESGDSSAAHRDEICADPPIVLISLDGFWAGYFQLYQQNTSFFQDMVLEGVQAQYMRSVFPTKTFPNHFSIVTGLYPESHGIVSNFFYDRNLNERFFIGSNSQNDPKWWLGEPVWVTAAKSGLRTGIYFWPGSEVPIQGIYPNFYFPYNFRVPYEERVKMVLSWTDLPKETRPQFMALYFNQPDHAGHTSGPNSADVDEALGLVSEAVESFFAGLEERGILDCVNVMIVSDHGMAMYDLNKLVCLDDLLPAEYDNFTEITTIGVGAEVIINDGDDSTLENVYNGVVQNIGAMGDPVEAFQLEDMPLRLHAGHFNKQRYGDIYFIGDVGSFITRRDVSLAYLPTVGLHGYDNNAVQMQAIFMAHGPAFKEGYSSEPFDNIQLYNLMCALLDISPAANNGSLGALYHLLKPEVAALLPPAVVPGGAPGVADECPFPGDTVTYNNRAFCSECICTSACGVDNTTIDEANRALDISREQAQQLQSTHLPWGIPEGGEGGGACLLTQDGYVGLYSNQLHIPLWMAYRLTAEQAQKTTPPNTCFRRDPRVRPADSANCSDYDSATGYVKTQLAPPADVNSQQLATSLLTNVAPQRAEFNESVWSRLETLVRQWAVAYGTVYVMSGSVLDANRDGRRDDDSNYSSWLDGQGSVAVPSHFYKIVIRCLSEGAVVTDPQDCPSGNIEALGVILPHTDVIPANTDSYIQFRLSTVRDIEGVTGVDFFSDLSAEEQNIVELKIVPALWPTAG